MVLSVVWRLNSQLCPTSSLVQRCGPELEIIFPGLLQDSRRGQGSLERYTGSYNHFRQSLCILAEAWQKRAITPAFLRLAAITHAIEDAATYTRPCHQGIRTSDCTRARQAKQHRRGSTRRLLRNRKTLHLHDARPSDGRALLQCLRAKHGPHR